MTKLNKYIIQVIIEQMVVLTLYMVELLDRIAAIVFLSACLKNLVQNNVIYRKS